MLFPDAPQKPNTYLLVDTMNLLFRCGANKWLSKLTTSDGIPSWPVFGPLNMLKSMMGKEEGPFCLVWCLEGAGGKKRRAELLPSYKAGRQDSELKATVVGTVSVDRLSKEEVEALPGPFDTLRAFVSYSPDDEADDTIATLTTRLLANTTANIVIMSSDKDMYALVGPRVKVYANSDVGVVGSSKAVQEQFGCKPSEVRMRKALMGDPSDSIPKVPRIKEATVELLQSSSLNQLLVRTQELLDDGSISKGQAELIFAHKDQIRTAYRVAKLNRSAQLKTVPLKNQYDAFLDVVATFQMKSIAAIAPSLWGAFVLTDGQEFVEHA